MAPTPNAQPQNRWLLALLAVVISAGCQSTKTPSVFSRVGWPSSDASTIEYEQPHRMAAIWKETVVAARPGKKATRGFGGRIYFYAVGDQPARVDGELTVYAFDDSNAGPEKSGRVPDRKYVFRTEEFQKHFSQSSIGASYSIWIPWDEVGGEVTTVSLLPVFKPANGTIVQAGQSIAVLPGKQTQHNQVQLDNAQIGVRQVNAEMPEGAANNVTQAHGTIDAGRRRRTTTINVPRSLGNQLKQTRQPDLQTTSSVLPSRFPGNEPVPADQRLYEKLRTENAQTQRSADPTRPVVFGSPGPVR